ncbi:hypothetical protein CPLU01_14821 [Colletotrichum plurivorum]|uniref:Uncharacterized protein n=1 Tax=Colletotrichum plurivorum TaxID=2175906 RepID=A0A8H6MXK9_9PEZI|nr:hypothetical protein CPLU01_14821 [Colletotrichum plurivorum]
MEGNVLPKAPEQVEQQPAHASTTSPDNAETKTDTSLPHRVQDSDNTPSESEGNDSPVFRASTNQQTPDEPVRVSTSSIVEMIDTSDIQHRIRFVFTTSPTVYMITLLPVIFTAYVLAV